MPLKIFLLGIILLIIKPAESQSKDSVWHIKYKMVEIGSINFDSTIQFPVQTLTNVFFDIYTDKRNYLIIPSLEDIQIGGQSLAQKGEKDESILIDAFENKVFFLYKEQCFKYKPFILIKKTDESYYYSRNSDTLKFIPDKTYGKEITPFPYYLSNEYGIKEITSKNINCQLIGVEKIAGNILSDAVEKTSHFNKTNIFFEFPW